MIRSSFSPRRLSGSLCLLACAALMSLAAQAQAESRPRPPVSDLAAFPPAPAGQVRRVIRLPLERDENALRVGVVVGRTMLVDCNRQILPARIEERTAEGWGFNYYVVTASGPPANTMMACPNNARTKQFVRAGDEPLLRYNSRVPLVIFAPTDVEVRYRIWRAGPEVIAR